MEFHKGTIFGHLLTDTQTDIQQYCADPLMHTRSMQKQNLVPPLYPEQCPDRSAEQTPLTHLKCTSIALHLVNACTQAIIHVDKMSLVKVYISAILGNQRNRVDTFSDMVTVFLVVTHITKVTSALCR